LLQAAHPTKDDITCFFTYLSLGIVIINFRRISGCGTKKLCMNSNHNRLQEYKTRAAILLKKFNSTDNTESEKAAIRFLKLPFLGHSTVNAILSDRSFFRLKHAQQVLAIENGYHSWEAFRQQVILEDCLFNKHSSAFLNVWLNNYEEAKAYQKEHGGYLLQFRKDYAVCPQDYIDAAGLSAFNSEWMAMQYDWVRPACKKSWQVVFDHLKKQYLTAKPVKPLTTEKSSNNRPQWLNDHINK
jgi:hypothetical protein